MSSRFLNDLNTQEFKQLTEKLFDTQNGKCFICEQKIDLEKEKHNPFR